MKDNFKPKRPYVREPFSTNQSTISKKLAPLFKHTQAKSRGQETTNSFIYLIDVNDLGEDGVDHINIGPRSSTELGQLLATSCRHTFVIFETEFHSIDNMLLYFRMLCSNEQLARANRDYLRTIRHKFPKNIPKMRNLYSLVCLAYYKIFQTHPELIEALKINNLPYDSYGYKRDGVRDRNYSNARLQIQAVLEARAAIEENRLPRLTRFFHNSDVGFLSEARAIRNGAKRAEAEMTAVLMQFEPGMLQAKYAEWKAGEDAVKAEAEAKQKAVANESRGQTKEVAVVDESPVQASETDEANVGRGLLKPEVIIHELDEDIPSIDEELTTDLGDAVEAVAENTQDLGTVAEVPSEQQ